MAVVPLTINPKSEPALELHSRAMPSVEAHHRVKGHRKKFRRKADNKNNNKKAKGSSTNSATQFFCNFSLHNTSKPLDLGLGVMLTLTHDSIT